MISLLKKRRNQGFAGSHVYKRIIMHVAEPWAAFLGKQGNYLVLNA